MMCRRALSRQQPVVVHVVQAAQQQGEVDAVYRPVIMVVYFSLGTNLGDKEQNLRMAVQKIRKQISGSHTGYAFNGTMIGDEMIAICQVTLGCILVVKYNVQCFTLSGTMSK